MYNTQQNEVEMVTAGGSQPNLSGGSRGPACPAHTRPLDSLVCPPTHTHTRCQGWTCPASPPCALEVGAIDWGLSSCAKLPSLGNRKIPAEEPVGTLGLGPPVLPPTHTHRAACLLKGWLGSQPHFHNTLHLPTHTYT
jgi:hypothetical protein